MEKVAIRKSCNVSETGLDIEQMFLLTAFIKSCTWY